MIQKPPRRRRNAPIRLRICTWGLLSEAIPRHRPCLSWKKAIAGPENHRPRSKAPCQDGPDLPHGKPTSLKFRNQPLIGISFSGHLPSLRTPIPFEMDPNIHNNHSKEPLPMTRNTHERDANKKIHHHDEYQQPVMKFPFRIFKTPFCEDQPESITAPQLNVASL